MSVNKKNSGYRMASSATWLEKMSSTNRIDRVLTRIINHPSDTLLPYEKEVGIDCRGEGSEDIQRRRILLAELILLWLANQVPDSHPILKLLQNDTAKSEDKIFIKKATAIIQEHLSDSSFGIEDFASEMAMSRSQLFRKFVAITGKSPSTFIRCIRLMRAANLIEQKFGNITEIALEVGYNNLAHFAHCFRCHFGILPSDYAKKICRN